MPQRIFILSTSGTSTKYELSVTGDKNFTSLDASTIVLLGDKLKNTDKSPNCKSASITPTASPLFLASDNAKFEISVVFPLLPLGLKNAIVSEDAAIPVLPKVSTASKNSLAVKGLSR